MNNKALYLVRIVIPAALSLTLAALACGPRPRGLDAQETVLDVYRTITAEAVSSPVPSEAANAIPLPTNITTPTATPPESRLVDRTGNPIVIPLQRCKQAIVVDGNLSDWDAETSSLALTTGTYGLSKWSGVEDAAGQARLCWTDSALYLLVEVIDDLHVQTQTGSTAWKGDEVELLFDADLAGDFYTEVWNNDDTQLGLSPGNFVDLHPAAIQYHPLVREASGVLVAAQPQPGSGGAYILEAAIPWSVMRIAPQINVNYGLCLALSDNDQPGQASQDSMVSHCPGLLVTDPTTWATIRLAP